jgi:hypothetical protein
VEKKISFAGKENPQRHDQGEHKKEGQYAANNSQTQPGSGLLHNLPS